MKQSRKASLAESVSSTVIGFAVSMGILEVVNQVWDLSLNLVDNVAITAVFTVASVLRQYGVRRAFNWWHHRGSEELPPVVSYSTGRWVGPPSGLSLLDQLRWVEVFDAGVHRASQEANEAVNG